jgi:hypothetical protein
MSACSAPRRPETPGRSTAWSCAIINQLATPGLGSIIGRRFVVGAGQLLLAVGGFVMIVGWMAKFFYNLYRQTAELPSVEGSYSWLGKWGAALFGVAWVWALFTSLSLLRAAKAEAELAAENAPAVEREPPKLNGL